MRCSFIVHAPSSIGKGKLAVVDKLLDATVHGWCLFLPPHGEECNFDVGEFTFGIFEQGANGGVEDGFDGGVLDSVANKLQ